MSATQFGTEMLKGDEKRRYVKGIFTEIAPRYDFLNHLLSLNIDKWWRRTAVRALDWEQAAGGEYLDLCAGTLDLAAELMSRDGFRGRVVGADFVVPMLKLGAKKESGVSPVGADALGLPFQDDQFDGCTVGFGVRNLADLDIGLKEMARVLRPGARLVILEFTTPTFWPMRQAYFLYFKRILPLIGKIVSKHRDAYDYLPQSVLNFPTPDDLVSRMTKAGFNEVRFSTLTMGIVAVHRGVKC